MSTTEQVLVQQQQELALQHQQILELRQTIAQLQTRFNIRPVLKPSKPSVFNGLNLHYSRTWLAEIEQYYRVINLTDEMGKVNFAAAQLREDAADWWRTVAPTDEEIEQAAMIPTMDIVNTWERFKEAFLKIFNPVPVKDTARHALNKLKQVGSITTYVNRFRYWIQFLGTSMDEEQRIFQFRQGLKRELQDYLLLVKPKTLNDAMSEAIRRSMEDSREREDGTEQFNRKTMKSAFRFNNQRPRRFGPSNYYNTPTRIASTSSNGGSSTSVPMELGQLNEDVEVVGMDVNALGLQPLTKAERDECLRSGKCFRCRQFGHRARDPICPKNTIKNNTPSARQHF